MAMCVPGVCDFYERACMKNLHNPVVPEATNGLLTSILKANINDWSESKGQRRVWPHSTGSGEMAHWSSAFSVLPEDQVQFPAPIRLLTTAHPSQFLSSHDAYKLT